MALTEKVQEQLAKYLAIGLLGFVLFVAAAIWILPSELLPTQLIAQLDEYSTGKNLLRLILLTGGLVAWIIYLRPCLRFDKKLGVFKDIKTGLHYCTRCKVEKKIKTPLQESEVGWYCVVCQRLYNNPNYKESKSSQKPKNSRI